MAPNQRQDLRPTFMSQTQAFLSGQIDFVSFLGVHCPICKSIDCYRPMASYWRYAIELFPDFKKKRIPIARFICRQRRKTFSLLPIQLIPYFQYTVGAVVGTLFLGMGCWQMGRKGFHGASVKVDEVDPEGREELRQLRQWSARSSGDTDRHAGLLPSHACSLYVQLAALTKQY